MKISDLKDEMKVVCRTGRAGRERVEWDGDWHEETLYVARFKGEIVTISLRSKNWAEGSMRDFCPNPDGGTFVVEDWYLQIKDLVP